MPIEADVDAIGEAPNGDLLVSFETSGNLSGVFFADEDVLRYSPQQGGWSLEVDASLLDGESRRGDRQFGRPFPHNRY